MILKFRIIIIAVAVVVLLWIFAKVKKNRVRFGDAIYWVCMSFLLVILGVFPQISIWLASLVGVHTPANFIYFAIISLLMYKLFSLSMKVSMLEDKLTILSIEMSIKETMNNDKKSDI